MRTKILHWGVIVGLLATLLVVVPSVWGSAECPVGSTATFSDNIGLKGGTAYTLTVDTTPTAAQTVTIPDFTFTLGHGPSLKVCASDADSGIGCDYTGDGTADDVEINAAVTALPATGGSVLLSDGTFTLAAAVTLDDYVRLEGQGDSTILTLANGADVHVISATGKAGVSIANLKIDGNGANQTVKTFGIQLTTNCTDFLIENVTIEENSAATASASIMVDNSYRGLISGVHISDDYNYGISLWESDDISVVNSYCEKPGPRGAGGHCFAATGSSGDHSRNITFSGNVVLLDANDQDGFQVYYTDGVVIDGNVIRGDSNGLDGIRLGDVTQAVITNNRIYNTLSGKGITDKIGGYNAATETVIEGNLIEVADYGIYIQGSRVAVNDNIIRNTTNDGITVAATAVSVTLDGNVIDQSGDHGISISAARTIINGNYVTNSADDTASKDGIFINDASYCIVTNNVFTDNQGTKTQRRGITTYGTSDYTVIIGNSLSGNDSAALSLVGSNNTVRANEGYITEKMGTDSIASGTTSKVVAHGLATTPTHVNVTMKEQGTNDYGRWWVGSIGATNFTLNVTSDPGASNLDFSWEAEIR